MFSPILIKMATFFSEKRDRSYTCFLLVLSFRIFRFNINWAKYNLHLQTLRIFPLVLLFKLKKVATVEMGIKYYMELGEKSQ